MRHTLNYSVISWSEKEYPMFREEVARIEALAERIAKLRGSL